MLRYTVLLFTTVLHNIFKESKMTLKVVKSILLDTYVSF